MKQILSLGILILTSVVLNGQYVIDKNESTFNWIGYGEIGDFQQTGTISALSGTMTFDQENLKNVEIIMDMETISGRDRSITEHLKNEDFFFVKKYPKAFLKMISFEGCLMTVELNIKGVAQQTSFNVSIEQNEAHLKATGVISIDRTKFGIKYNSSTYFQDLGSYAIKNNFDLKFDLKFTRARTND